MATAPEASSAAAAPPAKPPAAESPRTDEESGGASSGGESGGSPKGEALGQAAASGATGRPPPLQLVAHDDDDEASDSEEDEETAALNAAEREGEGEADLGTPLALGGGRAAFGDDDEFASHCFYGPAVPGDDAAPRVLHAPRKVHVHDKPPRFASEPPDGHGHAHSNSSCSTADSNASRRTSSSASALTDGGPAPHSRSLSEARSEGGGPQQQQQQTLAFTVTFDEPVLGFQTNVVVSLENEVVVEVGAVEEDGPAHRAGVRTGDWLVSVNGQRLETSMSREEVLHVIQSAARPRVLVFEREQQGHDRHGSDLEDDTRGQRAQSKGAEKKAPSKQLMGRLSSAVSYGSSIIGSKWKRKKPVVHPDSFCDGCGMDPIVGALWTCSECANFNLCTECYEMGNHGLENSDQMQLLSEALVQYKLLKKCKHFTPEFLLSLRRDICKGRPDKFEYMGGWIAEIVNGTAPSKITVRGIEVPSLPASSRQRFVAKLMGLVSNRRDIEVNIEWLPDDTVRQSMIGDEPLEEGESLEKLRIWISDKKTRTTSPFA